ncbi:MAG TPA: rhomboid family intramembrane serine protease, partial [bacterium]|nr:rhomboid family intramembrane serine protease [bacterium]
LGAGAGGGGVAWWAHVGGFVTGIVLVPIFSRRRGRQAAW